MSVCSLLSDNGRGSEWDMMSLEEKKKMIIEKKDKGTGRGVRRIINASVRESADCVDKVTMGLGAPFLTKLQSLSTLLGLY